MLVRFLNVLFNFFGLITVIYLISKGLKIKPAQDFFTINFWPVLVALWLLAPRFMVLLWLTSFPAGILTWVISILFGAIIAPRITWGFILLWHFSSNNEMLPWIVIILSLFIDTVEDAMLLKPKASV